MNKFMDIQIEQLKAIAELAKANDLAEITIADGNKQITIKTPASVSHTIHQVSGGPAVVNAPPVPMVPAPVEASASTNAPAPPSPVAEDASLHVVKAPMVGTFYASPNPDSEPFAPKGSAVKVGQTLCILEAMKQMNELESDVAGTIVEVLVENGQPIEYGQALFKVKV